MSQTIVITGASAGVGRALARLFAARGARIALIARGQAGLEAAAEEVRSLGGTALPITLDVADADGLHAAAARIEDELGPIDVWINNAMAAVLGEVADTSAQEFRRVTEVTYLGTVNGTLAALQRMLPRDRGHVILVGSALAHRGIPLQATYCGAKHAIQGFYESLRCELRHRHSGVTLSIAHLPGLNTTQFGAVRLHVPCEPQPVPPIYTPQLAARAIVWLADHPHRGTLWVGGSTALTIIGNRLAPWIAERYLARTGYSSQQTDTPAAPDRRDYLESPIDDERDRGTDGPFTDQAHDRSLQLWASTHRVQLLSAAVAAFGGYGITSRARAARP
ncbi:MAG TPA: SDR family oxidoreductase [Solirubrobacteraceae bacterium]|jgi:short-subunit dehydrogenase|nr:SDR family oxidoreductase [Solirubrobacteraceae bacterium]